MVVGAKHLVRCQSCAVGQTEAAGAVHTTCELTGSPLAHIRLLPRHSRHDGDSVVNEFSDPSA